MSSALSLKSLSSSISFRNAHLDSKTVNSTDMFSGKED